MDTKILMLLLCGVASCGGGSTPSPGATAAEGLQIDASLEPPTIDAAQLNEPPAPPSDASIDLAAVGVVEEVPVIEELTADEFLAEYRAMIAASAAYASPESWFARLHAAADRKWPELTVTVAVVTALQTVPSSDELLLATSAAVVRGPDSWPEHVTIEQSFQSCLGGEFCWRAGLAIDELNSVIFVVEPTPGYYRLVVDVGDGLYGFAVEYPDEPGTFQIPNGPHRVDSNTLGLAP